MASIHQLAQLLPFQSFQRIVFHDRQPEIRSLFQFPTWLRYSDRNANASIFLKSRHTLMVTRVIHVETTLTSNCPMRLPGLDPGRLRKPYPAPGPHPERSNRHARRLGWNGAGLAFQRHFCSPIEPWRRAHHPILTSVELGICMF